MPRFRGISDVHCRLACMVLSDGLSFKTFIQGRLCATGSDSIVLFIHNDGGRRLKGTVSDAVLRDLFVSLRYIDVKISLMAK